MMNGLPGDSLHPTHAAEHQEKKFITCVLCIKFVRPVYQGNVLKVESVCVCVCVCACVKCQTCGNTLQKAYYIIHI